MYREKRGLMLVVVLILFVLSSFMVFGEDFEGKVTYPAISLIDSDCDKPSEGENKCSKKPAVPIDLYCTTNDKSCSDDAVNFDGHGDAGCDFVSHPHEDGCLYYLTEEDSPGQDSCSYIGVPVGFNLDGALDKTSERRVLDINLFISKLINKLSLEIFGLNPLVSTIDEDDDDIGSGEYNMYSNLKVKYATSEKGIICGNDKIWQECNENTEGRIYWLTNVPNNVNNIPVASFICTKQSESSYVWVERKFDLDHDGYTEDIDCKDEVFLEDAENCPFLDIDEYQFLNEKDLRQYVRRQCGNNPKYSSCSACINPGAPEICGDEINNDCNAEFKDELDNNGLLQVKKITNVEDTETGTLDSCRANQAACEQRTVVLVDNEVEADVAVQANNNLGEKFSWVEQADGQGFCCGYNGISDVGEIIPDGEIAGVKGDFVCATSNKELFGFESPENSQLPYGWDDERCEESEWCLLEADRGAKFNVMTVKKPVIKNDEINFEIYDVVSNGESWFACNENTGNKLQLPSEGTDAESLQSLQFSANRFACFNEGNHYSWVECSKQASEDIEVTHTNKGIKGRRPGEGFYTLPLGDSGRIVEEITGFTITINSRSYRNYYGDSQGDSDFLFDFTGYDKLNFMVKFEEENVEPITDVEVIITGPGGSENIYFEKSVLGDVTNSPFLENGFMHVEIDIPELKAVKQVLIQSLNKEIVVRNVYLSNSQTNYLCTGQEAPGEWSWIEDIDQGDPNDLISGEDLCKSLYGEEAWLGDDDEVGLNSGSCCGNIKKEYYAGESAPFGDVADPDYYSCWNSLPLKSGDTVMDVEFEVGYKEDEFERISGFTDKEINYLVEVEIENEIVDDCIFTCEDVIKLPSYKVNCRPITDLECSAAFLEKNDNQGEFGEVCYIHSKSCQKENGVLSCNLDLATRGGNKFDIIDDSSKEGIKDFVESGERRNQIFTKLCPVVETITKQELSKKENEKISFGLDDNIVILDFFKQPNSFKEINIKDIETSGDVEIVFYYVSQRDPLTHGLTKILLGQVPVDETVYIIAILDKNSLKNNFRSTSKQIPPQPFSFACKPDAKGECLFPLPGNPPYKITNEHPGLYELYFVTGNTAEDETLITRTNQEFNEAGNIKARRVSEQVMFVRETKEDGSLDTNFYGCSAADYLTGNNKIQDENNLNQCSVKAGAYCAYLQKETGTVNSWSKSSLEEFKGVNKVAGEEQGLQVIEKEFKPEELTNPALVVPGRNILANAEFNEFTGRTIPGWDILQKQGNVLTPEPFQQSFIQQRQDELTGEIRIPANNILRSDRIPVEQDQELQFSIVTDSCEANLIVADKDGRQDDNNVDDGDIINTEDGAYVQLELSRCTFLNVSIQYLDDLGPAAYSFNNPQTLPRAGAACCPENYCWDGSRCAEPMTDYTSIAENVDEGRNYRCIAGEWTYQEVKKDWKNNLNGFCNANEQCLVRPSVNGGEARFNAGDFYDGNIPTCIENGQYIFDNLCEDGTWTSRTKALAEEMLARVGDGDHALFCTNFNDVFTNLNDNEKGLLQGVTPSTGDVGIGEIQSNVCFPDIATSEGSELVTNEENTCINNACVLQFRGKTALATTLNVKLNEPNSFADALGRQNPTCTGSDNFKDCQAGLFHDEDLDAVWFSKDNLDPEAGVRDVIIEFFLELFSREGDLTSEEFFSKVKNFKEIYSTKEGRLRVIALQEETSLTDKTLIAEYENFNTPVCEYVKEGRIDRPELGLELLESASGIKLVSCTEEDDIQRVEAVAGNDFLWPELTGKLRVS
jgi:hypothetical protein